MIKQCCQCGKVESNGLWLSTDVSPEGPVSHGYCPRCLDEALHEVDLWAESELAGEEVTA